MKVKAIKTFSGGTDSNGVRHLFENGITYDAKRFDQEYWNRIKHNFELVLKRK